MASVSDDLRSDTGRRLRLVATNRQLVELFGLSGPTVLYNWRDRHEDFAAAVLTHQPATYDVDRVVEWARRTDSPARLRRMPAWWWSRTVEAVRNVTTGDLEATRRGLAAVVLLRAALTGEVRSVRAARKRWDELLSAEDPSAAAVREATRLEDAHEALAHLLVEPLAAAEMPPWLLADVCRRLESVAGDGLEPWEQLDVALAELRAEPLQTGKATVTDDDLTSLVVERVMATPTDAVYDPCAGEGYLVVAVARALDSPVRLVVQEIDERALRIARTRILVGGFDAAVGEPGRSSLDEDQFPAVRAGLVVCDPPVSPKSPLVEWVDHVLAHLAPDGRAVVVLPAHALLMQYQSKRRLREDNLATRIRELALAGRVASVAVGPSRLRRDVSGRVTVWELRGAETSGATTLRWPTSRIEHTSTSGRETVGDQWEERPVDVSHLMYALDELVSERANGVSAGAAPAPSRPRSSEPSTAVERSPDERPASLRDAVQRRFEDLDQDLRELLQRIPAGDRASADRVSEKWEAMRRLLWRDR